MTARPGLERFLFQENEPKLVEVILVSQIRSDENDRYLISVRVRHLKQIMVSQSDWYQLSLRGPQRNYITQISDFIGKSVNGLTLEDNRHRNVAKIEDRELIPYLFIPTKRVLTGVCTSIWYRNVWAEQESGDRQEILKLNIWS